MNGQGRLAAITSVLLLLAGLLGVAAPSVATAEEHPTITLSSTSDTASWSGQFVTGSSALDPATCTSALCDIVPLQVQLPDKAWRQAGGMLVAIQSSLAAGAERLNNIDLFVYPPGCVPPTCPPAAKSANLLPSEAVWIENPVNGQYTVVVVPKWVVGQPADDGGADEPLGYDGFVKFDYGLTIQREELDSDQPYLRTIVAFGISKKHPVRELLPDLVPRAPRNFHIAYAQVPGGCLPTETLDLHEDEPTLDPSEAPLRCLRFDQGEFNFGDGPFELNIYQDDGGEFEAYQRIYSTDGTVDHIGPLGPVTYSEAHKHVHYLGFQDLTLHRIETDGTLTFVKQKPDKGWCPVDVWMGRFGRADQRTSPWSYAPLGQEGHCETASRNDPNDPEFSNTNFIEMGISVGWADIYNTRLPDQYIDITGLPDSDYAVVAQQDVGKHLVEKSSKNNTAVGCVRITGDLAEDISCGTDR